ncbi:MAG: TIGR02996 domain-containing protein [Gemmataceae bacterium]|nr:TIGR02996 domain-containing protein [Gemmata sp.]MDW8196418.1 TIGR02996 domain-containing protein [Gemmataceae bacterium]
MSFGSHGETHQQACAFLRKYLAQPTNAAARLVFADWLEETGQPQNIAWAAYIRRRHEADQLPAGSAARADADQQAAQAADAIRARLTIPAQLFVSYPKSLLQLLPPAQITVQLADFTVADHVCACLTGHQTHHYQIMPLDRQETTLLIAAARPRCEWTRQQLEHRTPWNIVMVAADAEELRDAIARHYPRHDAAAEDEANVAAVFPGPWEYQEPAPAVEHELSISRVVPRSIGELLQQLWHTAIDANADRILFFPDTHRVIVRFRIDDQWIPAEPLEPRWLMPLARELARRARIPAVAIRSRTLTLEPFTGQFSIVIDGARVRVRVTIQPSPDGPTMQVDLIRGRTPAG